MTEPNNEHRADAGEQAVGSATAAPAVVVAGSRWRVGLRAGIVLFLAALVIAVLVNAFVGRGDTVTITGGNAAGTGSSTSSVVTTAGAPPSTAAPPGILVHVTGAVRHPGLYDLDAGSRLVDAVFAAGGFTRKADESAVNLAREVADGEQIVVPRRGAAGVAQAAPTAAAGGAAATAPAGAVVDLNTADLAALDTLPGIGPALAQRILDWRAANGGFTSVDQLLDVSGIGETTLADLQALVTV